MKKNKTVEGITAKLHSTVAELESHADEQLRKADAQLATVEIAKAAHFAHKDEHARAITVADNIKNLLGL